VAEFKAEVSQDIVNACDITPVTFFSILITDFFALVSKLSFAIVFNYEMVTEWGFILVV